jgi:hypothetical protein
MLIDETLATYQLSWMGLSYTQLFLLSIHRQVTPKQELADSLMHLELINYPFVVTLGDMFESHYLESLE